MATAYQTPPWVGGISPAETGQLFAGGLRTGVGIAEESNRMVMEGQRAARQFEMEQQRLAQQKQIAEMETQARERELEATHALTAQRIEMDRAYHDQSVSLRQSQLEEAKQKTLLATKQAAIKFSAQKAMQEEIGDASDPVKVRQAMLKYGPIIGGMGPEVGAALRSGMEAPTSPVKALPVEGAPGYFQVPSPTGKGYQIHPQRPSLDDIKELTPAQAATIATHLPELSGQYGKDWVNEIKPELDKKIRQGLKAKTRAGKEVVRLTKDGRKAVFDADTKKFIRYAE